MQSASFDAAMTNPEGIEADYGDLRAEIYKTDQDDNLKRMLGYLTGSSPFGWMTQRIQAFVSRSRGNSLRQASAALLHGLRRVPRDIKNPTIQLSVDFNLVAYLEATFKGHPSLTDLICVNSDEGTYEASTLGEYMARMWPTTGTRFLKALQDWIDLTSNEDNDHLFDRM